MTFCLYSSIPLFSKDIICVLGLKLLLVSYVQCWNIWCYSLNIFIEYLGGFFFTGIMKSQQYSKFWTFSPKCLEPKHNLCLFLFRADMSKRVNWLLSSAWMSQGWVYFHCSFHLDPLLYSEAVEVSSFTDKMSKPLEWVPSSDPQVYFRLSWSNFWRFIKSIYPLGLVFPSLVLWMQR